jgi:hypothetical protein
VLKLQPLQVTLSGHITASTTSSVTTLPTACHKLWMSKCSWWWPSLTTQMNMCNNNNNNNNNPWRYSSDEPWLAEQPPLAIFPDCTRRYCVDMWSAHRIPQLHFQLSKPDCYFFIQVTTQCIRSWGWVAQYLPRKEMCFIKFTHTLFTNTFQTSYGL